MRVLIIVTILFLTTGLFGQDLHFSNFNNVQSALNPAMTGFIPMEDEMRASIIYRNQWSSVLGQNGAYKTKGASFDMRNCLGSTKVKSFNSGNKKYKLPTWGLGFSFLTDEAGAVSVKDNAGTTTPLKQDQFNLSASVIMPMNDKMFFSGGFRAGLTRHSLNTSNFRFDEQFDGEGGFNELLSNEFSDLSENLNSQMVNIGGGLFGTYLEKKWGINLGASVNHVFFPAYYTFFESEEQPILQKRYMLHGKGAYLFHYNKKKMQSIGANAHFVLISQNPSMQLLNGLDLVFQRNSDFVFTIGAGTRMVRGYDKGLVIESVLVGTSFHVYNFTFNFNYDLNQSNLREVSSGYGAYELGVTYRWRKKRSRCSAALEVGCVTGGKSIHPIFY